MGSIANLAGSNDLGLLHTCCQKTPSNDKLPAKEV